MSKENSSMPYEPKRQARFIVNFPKEFNIDCWLVRKINRPKYVNYKWENIEIVFIDPIEPSATQALFNLIQFIEKLKAHTEDQQLPLFIFDIDTVDPTGVVVEKWKICVAEIISINFGECDYDSDELQMPKMIIKPSFCQLIF